MKGTRTNTLPSLNGHMSGEPILRPMTSNSKASHSPLVSPTFDLNNVQSQSRDDEMRALNGIESGVSLFIKIEQKCILFSVVTLYQICSC